MSAPAQSMKNIKRLLRQARQAALKFRRSYFPTEHEKVENQWWADGGDYALRFNEELEPNSVVLDLGGFEGQWSSDLYARIPCNIYIFEPVKRFARNIAARFARNNQIRVLDYGLGRETRREQISVIGNQSSLYRESGQSEEIEIRDIVDWMKTESLSTIDLIKINIEGGEYEVLEHLIETGMIAKVKHIQVQFHDVAPDSGTRMDAIRDHLKKTHEEIYHYRFVWDSWRRCGSG